MRMLLFSEFYKGKFDDSGYELYLLKDTDGAVMYIGIARDSIWHRWFAGGTSHMECDSHGKLYGKSYIGEVIERRLPNSWNWFIELWTKNDCLQVCDFELKGKDLEKIGIELIETVMISKFEPLYNVVYGGGCHEDPLITKKLDKMYKDLFG